MKNIYTILFAVVAATGFLKASTRQDTTLNDFESGVVGGWVTWNASSTLSVVDNPNTTGNSSAKVLQWAAAGAYDGLAQWFNNPALKEFYGKITLDVYLKNNNGSINLHIDNPATSGAPIFATAYTSVTKQTWTHLEFDITSLTAYDYHQVAFQNSVMDTIYVDNIKFVALPEWSTFPISNRYDVKDLPANFETNMSLKWDVDSLYLNLFVRDTILYISPANTYTGDNIEIYFDMTNNKLVTWPRSATNYPPLYRAIAGCYQFRLVPDTSFYSTYLMSDDNHRVNGVREFYTKSDTGYAFSLAFPLDSLLKDFTPDVGDSIGFDVNVSDNDGDTVAYRNQVDWNSPLSTMWTDACLWGTLKFSKAGLFTQVLDNVNPTMPANLTATGGANSVKLTWDASTDNIVVQDYIIYKSDTIIDTILAKQTVNTITIGKLDPGDYTFSVRAMDLYKNKSGMASVTATVTALREPSSLAAIELYPNPSGDVVYLNNLKAGYVVVDIFDMTGKLLITQTATNSGNAINIRSLRSGPYLVKVIAGNDVMVSKLIKR